MTCASDRRCALCTQSQVGHGGLENSQSRLVCHEPVLRCASKPTPVLARSRTCRTCESALRSVGFVKGRCQSLSWPSRWAMQRTAHSAMPSNGRPAWHPNTTNLYLQEWMNRPHDTCVESPTMERSPLSQRSCSPFEVVNLI